MTKEYPCYIQGLNKVKMCKYGGNKAYNYGFMSGTASYCRKVSKWVSYLEKCPLEEVETPQEKLVKQYQMMVDVGSEPIHKYKKLLAEAKAQLEGGNR